MKDMFLRQKNIQCANQEGAESPDVLLVGDSAGLVRALRLEALHATRGHDGPRSGDGIRLRSSLRS